MDENQNNEPQDTSVADTTDSDLNLLTKRVLGKLGDGLKNHLALFMLIPMVLMGLLTFNYYNKYQLIKTDPQKVATEENKALVAHISKFLVLPEGEEPTIVTVSDPSALQDQSFFAKAQRGDKVLIYNNARKAILYNVAGDKITEVASLNISNPRQNIETPKQ